ncbi:hypothetical protein BC332_33875 [Capsicum chinense]|nr:hypothetical protein BC332_33875 [Capsicum chinense]
MVPWCHDALVHGATVPWCLGAMVPWCLGAFVTWCVGAMAPLCLGFMVRWSLVPMVCSYSNPSQKIKVGRRCTPRRDTTNQLPYALQVYSPVDSHTCQTPWSIFEDGSNGEPTGQRPYRADGEACWSRVLPTTIDETAFHKCIESPGFSRPPINAGPCPESIGGPTHRHSTSDRAHRQPPSASLPIISSTL